MTLFTSPAQAYIWQKIDTGLYYAAMGNLHAFQIDPKRFRFSVATAKDLKQTDATVTRLAKKSGAILAVNGGFFSPEHESLGLLMREGQMINPPHKTPWWAVFQMKRDRPEIVTLARLKPNPALEMALQAGPRLVIHGNIPKLKPSVARRSGIGIQPGGSIVIAVTDDTGLSMETFAEMFRKPQNEGGLGCANALNLDGGGSTQLYFDWKGFKLEIPGTSRITNAVTIFPR